MLSLLFLIVGSVAALPVVSFEFFTPGRSWTWDYRRVDDGVLYSSETYTVIQRAGRQVLLEMSTVFPGRGAWGAHHRLLVNVDKCLAAHAGTGVPAKWSFRMFYKKSDGRWEETWPPSTLAFEEKFNCDSHVRDMPEFLTIFRDGQRGREFMHKVRRVIEGSWFSIDGESAGVMSAKIFDHGSGTEKFLVRRREDFGGDWSAGRVGN